MDGKSGGNGSGFGGSKYKLHVSTRVACECECVSWTQLLFFKSECLGQIKKSQQNYLPVMKFASILFLLHCCYFNFFSCFFSFCLLLLRMQNVLLFYFVFLAPQKQNKKSAKCSCALEVVFFFLTFSAFCEYI